MYCTVATCAGASLFKVNLLCVNKIMMYKQIALAFIAEIF